MLTNVLLPILVNFFFYSQVTTILPDADTPMTKVKGLEKDKNLLTYILQSMWQQTAPLFMREHLRKTFLSSLILYIIFFSAHGVYMWFPYILNNTMQYTEKFTEPMRICDIIKFVRSGNLTNLDADVSVIIGPWYRDKLIIL